MLFFVELTYVNGLEIVKSNKNVTSSKSIKTIEKVNYPKKVIALKKKITKLSAVAIQPSNKTISKKKLKPITDIFKDLPADDFAFIKELDKQFNLHGGKLKIKVQNDNTTSSKTSKRTIDGDLGYGYQSNAYNNNNGLKYVFYPYSQHDIPAAAPQQSRLQKPSSYYLPTSNEPVHKKERVTEVTIQPSYSYELKANDFYQGPEHPHIDLPAAPQYQQQPQNYEEPVIILRIPGPTKYAAHLQALLQQYLEIRAAQYLQILEAHELRYQQQLHQQQQQYEQTQQQYEQPQQQYEQPKQQFESPQQQYEQPQQQYEQPQPQYEQPEQQYEQPKQQFEPPQQQYEQAQQQYSQPHKEYGEPQQAQPFAAAEEHAPQEQAEEPTPTKTPEQSSETPYPPQELKAPEVQTTPQPQQEYTHQYHRPQVAIQQEQQPEHYAYYNQVNAVYKAPIVRQKEQQAQYYYNTNMQNIHSESPVLYLVPMVPNEYLQPQAMPPIYVHNHQQEEHLPITENSPRPTHTKVIFKSHKPAAVDHNVESYVLPTIRPYERHAPVENIVYRTYYPHHQDEQTTSQIDLPYPRALSQEVIITQRPHKYRSHRQLRRGRRRGTPTPSSIASTTSSTFLDEQDQHLRKIRNYVHEKFGAQTGFSKELPSKSNSQKN